MITASLPAFLSDRRCVLFGLTGLLAVFLAFVAVPDRLAIGLVSKFGFWFVLVAFVLWLQALWQTFKSDLQATKWSRMDWLSIAVVAAGGIFLPGHETFWFKIVIEEIIVLWT